jgi:hypothetical protein
LLPLSMILLGAYGFNRMKVAARRATAERQ